MNEIIEKRKEASKVFDLGNGVRKLIIHCKPIHYFENNKWQEIKNNFLDDNTSFVRNEAKVITRIKKNNTKKLILLDRTGCSAEITIDEIILDSKQISLKQLSDLKKQTSNKLKHSVNSSVDISYEINEVSSKIWVEILTPISSFIINKSIRLTKLKCSNIIKDNYYVPDEYGRFNFIREDNSLMFFIPVPEMIDANGKMSDSFNHTLTTELKYSKFPIGKGYDDLVLAKYPIKTDASPYYSSSSDGYVYNQGTDVATVRDAATGTVKNSAATFDTLGLANYVHFDGKVYDILIGRVFLYFDTADIPDTATIDTASVSIFVGSNSATVYAQKGTQADTLTTADFDSFSGSAYGSGATSFTVYTVITFDSTGKTDINKAGTTKICVRNSYDYLNTLAYPVDSQPSVFYSEYTGTDHDPYLSVTYTDGASSAIKSVNGLAKASVKSVNGLAIASVKSWNGLA
jgi:hypothetical protein